MVSTEILPRCSRTTNASSDTTYLHFSAQLCAPVYLFCVVYNMTCKMQVMFADHGQLNYNHHLIWRHQRLASAGVSGTTVATAEILRECAICRNASNASGPVHRLPDPLAAANPLS